MTAELYIVSGLGLFIVLHILTGLHEWRQAALEKLGIILYRVLFSIATLLAIWTIVQGFDMRPFDVWWQVPAWSAQFSLILMPLAILFFVCHFMSREKDTFTRQPIGWAIMFWALAHLMANGESGTTLLFGGFLIYGALAIFLRERKASLGDKTACHSGDGQVRLIPFSRWPRSLSGKDIAFLFGITALLTYGLIYFHGEVTGLSAMPVGI